MKEKKPASLIAFWVLLGLIFAAFVIWGLYFVFTWAYDWLVLDINPTFAQFSVIMIVFIAIISPNKGMSRKKNEV